MTIGDLVHWLMSVHPFWASGASGILLIVVAVVCSENNIDGKRGTIPFFSFLLVCVINFGLGCYQSCDTSSAEITQIKQLEYGFSEGSFVKHILTGEKGIVVGYYLNENRLPYIYSVKFNSTDKPVSCKSFELEEWKCANGL